jgi:hypothetical protein
MDPDPGDQLVTNPEPQCCGSVIRCFFVLFDMFIRDPRWEKSPDPATFWPWIRDPNLDQGSGINISDPQHCGSGSYLDIFGTSEKIMFPKRYGSKLLKYRYWTFFLKFLESLINSWGSYYFIRIQDPRNSELRINTLLGIIAVYNNCIYSALVGGGGGG